MAQRLTFRELQAHLADYREDLQVKSVSTPSAQSNTLLHGSTLDIDSITSQVTELLQSKRVEVHVLAVIELQFLYGLRISEVLNIQRSDVKPSGHIYVRGSKGSEARVVIPMLFSQFWLPSGGSVLPLSSIYSRFYFYRKYKDLGLYLLFAGQKNNSVTHVFRNILLQKLANVNVPRGTLQKFIGHKNIKNTNRYVNKKKSK